MSPLWRDQLRIVLCPDKVLIVRIGKGLRPAIVSKHHIECEPTPGLPAWFAALNALMQWLTESKPGKADVLMILSNHFVRYGVLPWTTAIDNKEEDLAFARIHFEKVYGEIAREWSLRISDAPYESPRIASAIDQELLDGLTDLFKGTSLRLVSVQPYLMSAFNAYRKKLSKQSGLFLLIEAGKACLLRIAETRCTDVKGLVLQKDTTQDLAELLNRELLLFGIEENPHIFLHAAEYPKLDLTGKVPGTIKALPLSPQWGFSPLTDAQYGMALHGVA